MHRFVLPRSPACSQPDRPATMRLSRLARRIHVARQRERPSPSHRQTRGHLVERGRGAADVPPKELNPSRLCGKRAAERLFDSVEAVLHPRRREHEAAGMHGRRVVEALVDERGELGEPPAAVVRKPAGCATAMLCGSMARRRRDQTATASASYRRQSCRPESAPRRWKSSRIERRPGRNITQLEVNCNTTSGELQHN